MRRSRSKEPFTLGQEVEVLGRRGTVIAILTVPSCIVRFPDGKRYIIRQSALRSLTEHPGATVPTAIASDRRDLADTPLLRRTA